MWQTICQNSLAKVKKGKFLSKTEYNVFTTWRINTQIDSTQHMVLFPNLSLLRNINKVWCYFVGIVVRFTNRFLWSINLLWKNHIRIESHANLFSSISMTTMLHTPLQSGITTGALISFRTFHFVKIPPKQDTMMSELYSSCLEISKEMSQKIPFLLYFCIC